MIFPLFIAIQALNEYLEEKRAVFPRFYFIGDEDLLEILGQSTNPRVIQSHLKKMFAGKQLRLPVRASPERLSLVALPLPLSVPGINTVRFDNDNAVDRLDDLAGLGARRPEAQSACLARGRGLARYVAARVPASRSSSFHCIHSATMNMCSCRQTERGDGEHAAPASPPVPPRLALHAQQRSGRLAAADPLPLGLDHLHRTM